MCSENKGTDQLCSDCKAALRLYILCMLLVSLCGRLNQFNFKNTHLFMYITDICLFLASCEVILPHKCMYKCIYFMCHWNSVPMSMSQGDVNVIFHLIFVKLYMSRRMRKPTICICENKGADQLRGNREADQRPCFRYTYSTIPLLLISKISSI